jgi:hypothetical protein
MELSMVNTAALAKEGRSFDCKTCPTNIKKIRRCEEDREDFDGKDGPIWPMTINKGGQEYGFCPGKATWDFSLKTLFDELIVLAETKWLPFPGGMYDQPTWVIETMAWFLPTYDFMKFLRKADMILGSTNDKSGGVAAAAATKKRGR